MWWRLIFSLAVFLMAACTQPATATTSYPAAQKPNAPVAAPSAPDSPYQILSSSVDPNKGACCNHIVGEVKNTGARAGKGVRVVATLYDGGGTVVGTENDLVSGAQRLTLAPGETAPFSIMVEKTTAFATYKLSVSE